ncbi:MAG: hypothetical protein LUE13_05570 [Akkermansiaceae bacterium]|nr:hypothetical protein [Akkermansiaceae bacterium]
MRSFFGSILLILVLAALGATIYYHWSTNSHLEFELRHPDEPEKDHPGDQHGKTRRSPPAGCRSDPVRSSGGGRAHSGGGSRSRIIFSSSILP